METSHSCWALANSRKRYSHFYALYFLLSSAKVDFFCARLDIRPLIFSSLTCSHLSLPKIPFLCLLNNKPASTCRMESKWKMTGLRKMDGVHSDKTRWKEKEGKRDLYKSDFFFTPCRSLAVHQHPCLLVREPFCVLSHYRDFIQRCGKVMRRCAGHHSEIVLEAWSQLEHVFKGVGWVWEGVWESGRSKGAGAE